VIADLLPWLQLLLLPACGLLIKIEGRLSRLEASRVDDRERIGRLEARIEKRTARA